jgi:hypothetical protein
MTQPKKCTAIKAWLALMLFWLAGASLAAQVAGTVVQLSGPLMAQKADGAVRILSKRSEVESGDTLITEKNTYAMVKFIDNSEITLKPSTTFKVDNFSYDADKPDGDKASFNLLKGGLRSVTGLLGKRNKEKFEMKTPSATIGIRGTTFIAEWVQPLVTPAPPNSQPPGLYVQVTDGSINLSNQGGSQLFGVGQFGYVPSALAPPVIVPQNPGIQFTPPPAFNSSTGPANSAGAPQQPEAVDCVVR